MKKMIRMMAQIIFMARWLQAPLYLGLIIVLGAYGYKFLDELYLLMTHLHGTNNDIMLAVLDLIDVVMIANLLIMVIIGGYETFVSKLNLKVHADHPEWLDEVNAGSMKVKLAISLIGISSIHLLRTFIDPSAQSDSSVMWQVVIHMTLIISAIAIAFTNWLMAAADH